MTVVGLGGIGMNAPPSGVVAGNERIVAVDLNADKLRLAREIGATDTFLAGNADVEKEIHRATGGGGLDYLIETADSIPATYLAYAIAAPQRNGGSAGLPAATATFPQPHSALVSDGNSAIGRYIGSCVPKIDIPHFTAPHQRGRLPVQKLCTRYINIDEFTKDFDSLPDRSVPRPHA
jgi:alcohol dehydrogenase